MASKLIRNLEVETGGGGKKIAIIMAGNIPLVGFHDFISVLISGHDVLVKQSSIDRHLLPFLAKYLEHVAPGFKKKITFTEDVSLRMQ
jgi:hypothetical protein